ncbi:MAG: hypothetical protein O2821_09370 [Chloroflexi bacterium]|nr:hypothetical protein [Chloroflexota bacterium]MDA1228877.1 hypothetical protein [Chloroflexota bacterium]
MILDKIRSLPLFVLIIFGFVIVVSASGVATLTINTTTTQVDLSAENFVVDPDTNVSNTSISMSGLTVAANGDNQGSPVDVDTALVTINTPLNPGDFVYQFTLQEIGIASWDVTRQYRIETFADGQSLGILYINNSTDNAAAIEGATVRVGLGTGVPDSMTVKVDRF